ncbi:high affinity zinc ion transporter [Aspergillus niger]|uniref:High affinity zinc ion transporter n=1 Tax=Aspergillus niger TaxID=5061 RepID=A0A100ILQ3_ASPNG|nr:high affinity zinc ion transporter [Aspergillus niger]
MHMSEVTDTLIERSFKQQIAAFLILEFGVIFHSVIIGLNLGVTGDEFATLYPVLVFHQSFEGLGIMFTGTKVPYLDRKDGHATILSLLDIREEKPRTYPLYGGKLLMGFTNGLLTTQHYYTQ